MCETQIVVNTTYSLSTLARGKRKYVMRFEIRYFFLEIGLRPRASMLKPYSVYYYLSFTHFLRGDGGGGRGVGGPKSLSGKIPSSR